MKNVRAVLINNCPQTLNRLHEMAETAGLTVVGVATSPRTGIAAVENLHPDILILDMNLDQGSGVEVLNYLHQATLSVQTLVVTGSPSDVLAKKCKSLGARNFFDAALDIDGLASVLKDMKLELSGASA